MYIVDVLRCPNCRRVLARDLRLGAGARIRAACWSSNCRGIAGLDVSTDDQVVVHVTDDRIFGREDTENLENSPFLSATDPVRGEVDLIGDRLVAVSVVPPDAVLLPSPTGNPPNEVVITVDASTVKVATSGRKRQ